MTLQDHVVKGYCDFMGESFSLYLTNYPGKFRGHSGSEHKMVLSQVHVTKAHVTLWKEAYQGKLPSYQVWCP